MSIIKLKFIFIIIYGWTMIELEGMRILLEIFYWNSLMMCLILTKKRTDEKQKILLLKKLNVLLLIYILFYLNIMGNYIRISIFFDRIFF